MRRFCAFLFVLVCSAALVPFAHAQGGKGTIAGRVTDSSNGALIGAQVSVQPIGLSVVSDARGQFFVNDLEPGSYTVTITYVGFAAFTQTLTVNSGQAANVDAKLDVESQDLKVLVTAERASGEEAMIQAGRRRLRPIAMTALATIAGMLPLAFGIGAGSAMLKPLAIAVIGGILSSMVLSLIFTPAIHFYLLPRTAAYE